MSKKLKIFLGISYLLIVSIFLYFIFLQVEISRLNDFSYYKETQVNLESYIGDNLYINLLIFFLFCVVWISLLGFGTPILLVSGILFGKWIGTLISVVSVSAGALLLYSISNFFFRDLINKLLEKKFSKYIVLFNKNEFFYFFIFRLTGGLSLPFVFQNTLPVIFNIKKINYFFATLLGFIPVFFIWNTIGSGINQFIKLSNNFSFIDLLLSSEIYIPIISFVVFIFMSLAIQKYFFNVSNK
jgi:uncharacterized membrane protein YdjX (TVP38/TMEM64 family)